jgi:hypothetical protein
MSLLSGRQFRGCFSSVTSTNNCQGCIVWVFNDNIEAQGELSLAIAHCNNDHLVRAIGTGSIGQCHNGERNVALEAMAEQGNDFRRRGGSSHSLNCPSIALQRSIQIVQSSWKTVPSSCKTANR